MSSKACLSYSKPRMPHTSYGYGNPVVFACSASCIGRELHCTTLLAAIH